MEKFNLEPEDPLLDHWPKHSTLRYLTINCNNGTRIKTEEEEIPFSNIFQKIFYWIIGKRI